MDVWLHGPALVALWVIAVCAVLLVLFAWLIAVRVHQIATKVAPVERVATAEMPRPPG